MFWVPCKVPESSLFCAYMSDGGEAARLKTDRETLRETVLALAFSPYTETRIGRVYIREQTTRIRTINGMEGVHNNDLVDEMVVWQ